MIKFAIAAAAFAALATPAFAQTPSLVQATSGYLYFNRPGSELATHDSELRNCVQVWQGGVRATPSINHGIVGDLISDAMISGWERARRAINIEHCMIVRGWRLVRIDPNEGRRLASLERTALAAELAPMIGAETPPGAIVRVWANEASLPSTVMGSSPENAERTLLSDLAMNPDAPDPANKVLSLEPSSPFLLRNRSLAGLRPAELSRLGSGVPEGSAVIVVGMAGPRSANRYALSFDREFSDDYFHIGLRGAPSRGAGRQIMQAYVVNPGHWRIYGFGVLFDYCLGAPSFTIEAGQVLYLGEFDLTSPPLRADLSLPRAEAFLASAPALAQSVRAASWTNGSTWPCRLFHPYALELEGAPFESDYHWGSAVGPRTVPLQ